MRFWLGHRLPGGFWGGIGIGGYGRRRRVVTGGRRRQIRYRVRTGPAFVVHMSGQEYAANQARQQERQAKGCAVGLVVGGAVVVISLIVEFWYIAVPALVVAGVLALVGHRQQRTKGRPPGSGGEPR